jgi:hypothetical protein
MLRQFDVVQLTKVDNVKYLSGPKGRSATPKGNWTVIGFIENDVVIERDNTVVRMPANDVVRIAAYDIQTVMDAVKRAKPKF